MKASEVWNDSDKATRLTLIIRAAQYDPAAFKGVMLEYRALARWEHLTEPQRKAIIVILHFVEQKRAQIPLFPVAG